MKKSLGLISAVFFLLTSCTTEVSVGEIVKCKKCGTEISNTVTKMKVPSNKAQNYRIRYSEKYCDKCGNEEVAYTVHYNCQYCGTNYTNTTKYALRKEEKKDEYVTNGFCSNSCNAQDRVNKGVEKIGEKAAEVGSKLLRGIERGSRR